MELRRSGRQKQISAKELVILIMMIFVIPLMVFLLLYNIYTVGLLNSRLAEAGTNIIHVQKVPMEQELHNIEDTMVDVMANDANFQQMLYSTKRVESYLNQQQVIDKLKRIFSTNNVLAGTFIYDARNEMVRELYNGSYSYESKVKIKEILKECRDTEKKDIQKKWFIQSVENKNFLFRVLKKKDVYLMSVFDLDKQIQSRFEQTDPSDCLFFVSDELTVLTQAKTVEQKGIEIREPEQKGYYMSGNPETYMVTREYLDYAGIYLYYAKPYQSFLTNSDKMPAFFLSASFIVILLLLYSFQLLKKKFLNPLNSMVTTMETIKSGNIEAKMNNENNVLEFEKMVDTFNEMMDEIKLLKISAYEYRIQIQQANLQYLQIQIRPHFYLNCLKNLYGLAQEKKYIQIQDTILALSVHLRYVFQNNMDMVPIKEELNSVKNYILLQQMTAAYQISCNIDLSEELKDYEVPPLSILTFVENAVKHADKIHDHLKLQVRAGMLQGDGERFVNITILDNGKGFSQESLQELNENGEFEYRSQHIGIMNVKQRFQMIYQKKCTFSFFNITGGGAGIEIFIPVEEEAKNV